MTGSAGDAGGVRTVGAGAAVVDAAGVAAARVAALRAAFAATMTDPDFLAEGERVGLG
jgi:hypothetical protein